jgi:6-phosphogluconate dehydrogenase
MGGGDKSAWDRVGHILEAISAKYEDEPCAAFLGAAGAGHLVKTVHNGIEYADMQMIAEVYGVMRDGFGMSAADVGEVLERWNGEILQSYLIEISGKVAKTPDPETGKPMLDIILDTAGQKGTAAGQRSRPDARHACQCNRGCRCRTQHVCKAWRA